LGHTSLLHQQPIEKQWSEVSLGEWHMKYKFKQYVKAHYY
jgi:hypothetical protein